MKTIRSIALLGFTCLATTSYTSELPASGDPFQGVYVGVGLGGHIVSAVANTLDESAPQVVSRDKIDTNKGSLAGRIRLGYDHVFNDFLMGVSADYLLSRNKRIVAAGGAEPTSNISTSNSSQVSTTITMNSNNALRLGLKFGYKLTPKSLVYVSPAWEMKKVKASYVVNDNNNLPSMNKNLSGFNVEVGAESMTSDCLGVFVSAGYSTYQKKSASDGNLSFQVKPTATTIMVGMKYYFGKHL